MQIQTFHLPLYDISIPSRNELWECQNYSIKNLIIMEFKYKIFHKKMPTCEHFLFLK